MERFNLFCIPLKSHNSIKYGEKLRLVVNPDEIDAQKIKAGIIEILNPLEKRVVSGDLKEIDPSKLVYFDVIIPENWICGSYTWNIFERTIETKHMGLTFSQVSPILLKYD